jgi:hypothetical protein
MPYSDYLELWMAEPESQLKSGRPQTGMKSVRVPSHRSIHPSPRSHGYGQSSLGFGLTRLPCSLRCGVTFVRRPIPRLTRHHWSGGVIGRPVSAGRPLTIPPSQRWCHPLTDSKEKEWQ